MRLIGYRNVRGKLYPGMRHEILNEKEKYRVYGDVWKWLKKEKWWGMWRGKHTPADPGRRSGRERRCLIIFEKTLISKKLMSVFFNG